MLHTIEKGNCKFQFPFYLQPKGTETCYNIGVKGRKRMYTVFVVSIIIVIVVLLLAVITTSKAYSYKHTVDSIENNPYIDQEKSEDHEKKNA